MKTTIEIPDELFRASKAMAAANGASLKSFVCEALEAKLALASGESAAPVWHQVFGRARPDEVEKVDRVIEDEFERVDPAEWK